MTEMIFIVERLWIDTLENDLNKAMGYEMIGYVHEEDLKDFYIPMRPANGWPLFEPTPLYRLTRVERLKRCQLEPKMR